MRPHYQPGYSVHWSSDTDRAYPPPGGAARQAQPRGRRLHLTNHASGSTLPWHAQGARSKGLRMGLRLFGCWGPVPWLFMRHLQHNNQSNTTTGTQVLAGCASEVLGSSPRAVFCYGREGEGGLRAQAQCSCNSPQGRNQIPKLRGEQVPGPFLGYVGHRPRAKCTLRAGEVGYLRSSEREARPQEIDFQTLGSTCIFHQRGVTRRRDVMYLPESKGDLCENHTGD